MRPDEGLEERYVLLALRLGRHDEDLVETYYGPRAIAERVDSEAPSPPAALVTEADQLLQDLDDGWLHDQVTALRTRAGILAGETWSYADEVATCFGVEPTRTDESAMEAAYDELERLLPGPGPLRDRYRAWEHATRLPDTAVPGVVDAVVEESRGQARRLFGMPTDESFDLEYVSGQGWMAFHEYVGDLRAHVSVNTDLPRPAVELLHTVLHETYAGHHAEACLKEHLLVRGEGKLAPTITVVPTPHSVVSEGLAETGPALLMHEGRAAYDAILRDAGLDVDLDRDRSVQLASEPLLKLGSEASTLMHQDGWTTDAVLARLRRWALVDEDLLQHVVRFVSDPSARGYIVCYPEGRARCRAFVGDDPVSQLDRFRILLTQPVRVRDLVAPSL